MDSDTENIEEFSGIEQPPLLEQIKRILDEYRNDVQIIKELIQNADDANATEMRILYEGRIINPEREDESEYCRFLRAPALVFYNNKTFTELDWTGIRSIYTSVKRDDPLKIGRFGLGFKSVFHLTDYPCIISGECALFINPHAKEFGKICVMVKLKDLTKWHRLNEKDYRNSLINTFGFDDDTLTSGFYNGTMFWFPLRQHFSSLSENTYPEENVYNLLHAFISESDRSLLFLKTLCSITLYVDMQDSDNRQQNLSQLSFKELNSMNLGKEKPYFIVSVNNKSNDIEKERALFLKELQDIGNEVSDVSKQWVFDITVQTLANTFEEDSKIAKSRWLIVNYLKGGDISEKLGLLMKDKELGYPHIVGVAASIDEQNDFTSTSGHVFCYQPLPQENVSMTGLPVHINGFFSLSQNRRHVRWPDQGDLTKGQGDKKIEWNLELLTQLLPEAYEILLKELANLCQKESNPDYLLKALYNAVPDLLGVNEHWHTLAEIVLELCNDKSIFYTEQDGGRWIQIHDAVFTKSRQCAEQTNQTDEYMDTVFDLLILDKVNAVVVPNHVSESFKKIGCKVTYAKPAYLKSHMAVTHHSNYKGLNLNKKQDLFEYVMLDSSTEGLENLELLPLADGTFTTFSAGKEIIVETNDIVETFPGQESNFVNVNLRKKTITHLTELADKGEYCLAPLSDDATVTMVTNVLQNNFGGIDTVHVKQSEAEKWGKWVRDIWNLVQKRFRDSIKKFIDCPIFPIKSVDNGENMSDFLLIKLSTNILYLPLLNQIEDRVLIKRSFDLLSVSVTENIPFDIDVGLISHFLYDDTSKRITSLFGQLSSQQVCKFNNDTCDESSAALLSFLAERIHTSICKTGKQTIRKLRLFRGYKIQTQSDLVSLNEIDYVYYGKEYPVHFPFAIIMLNSNEEKVLAERLDANVVSELELVRKTICSINEYKSNEQEKFVFWIILKGEHFQYHDVQEKLKHVAFVKSTDELFYKPSDLFDPSEQMICDLFKGEAFFPVLDEHEHRLLLLDGLKSLGLKTIKNLTVHDINRVSKAIHHMTDGTVELDLTKCKALLHVMNEYSHLVQKDFINTRRCIFIEDTMEDIYSKNIPLKNRQNNNSNTSTLICTPKEIHSAKHVNLIGSVMFIIDSKRLQALSGVFRWDSQPKVCMVLEHLHIIVKTYQSNLKASYLPIVTCIYEWLSKQDEVGKDDLKIMIKNRFPKPNNSFVWDGSIFQPIEAMYIEKSKGEIDLKPFLYPLPAELQTLADFFMQLGCLRSIGYDSYVATLQQIKIVEQQTIDDDDAAERFTEMAIAILNRIKKNFLDDFFRSERNIFFPTIGESGGIQMIPTESCTYCDEQWLKNMDFQFDSDIHYIHPDLPISTAEALGVPSLRQQMMSDTEAFAEWGQEEPLTRRLRNLLKEGYVDGFSVAKELFQNADDAGAKTLCILFDERENNEAKTGLISDKMAECQGPAIWAYNDEQFTESDFRNITKLSGATKEDDSTKIGKFGLGFCSVYNITDVPSFVSGENMVIFDPDMSHLGNVLSGRSPGLRVNFGKMSNVKLLKSLRNQFLPFEGIFDCRILDTASPFFKGTLFRLPLRNKASDISDVVYTRTEVKELFEKIMSMAANMLLFNQNIVHFKLLHIPKTEHDPKKASLLFEVHKTAVRLCAKDDAGLNASSMLVEASERKRTKTLLHNPLLAINKVSVRTKAYFHSNFNTQTVDNESEVDWFICWSTGIEKKTICMSYEEKGTLPLGAVAIPVKHTKEGKVNISSLDKLPGRFYQTGHLFFFLPLPIEHKFPFHINSQFAVTSDRRQLRTATEDDKNVKMKDWNRYLLEDSVTQALLFLLTQLHSHISIGEYHFSQFWPKHDTSEVLEFLPAAFYRNVVKPGIYDVFEKNGQWFDISRCIFVERSLRTCKIGDIVFEVLSMLNEFVVDVSDNVYDMLSKADQSMIEQRTVTAETFFLEYLFPNLEDFSSGEDIKEKRKKLLYYAVDLQKSEIDQWLKQNKSIPSQPYGILKSPDELVDINSFWGPLFVSADGFFPECPFTDRHISIKLQSLGLIYNVLSDEIVLNRAKSIESLHAKCWICSVERSGLLLSYLAKQISVHQSISKDLSAIKFIPVQKRPTGWIFDWHADMFGSRETKKKCKIHSKTNEYNHFTHFERPASVYDSHCKNIVGCIAFVFDNSSFQKHFQRAENRHKMLKSIGINGVTKNNVDVNLVINQLLCVATSFEGTTKETTAIEIYEIMQDIYYHINNACMSKEMADHVASLIKEKAVVFVSGTFVTPNLVARHCIFNCRPYLFSLEESPLRSFERLSECLSIKDYFEPSFIALVLQDLKNDKGEKCLSEIEIRVVINDLNCLKYSMLHGKATEVRTVPEEWNETIYGPDEDGILKECRSMCFNDYDGIEKSESMIYSHISFPADLAKFFGVKPKIIHSFEECSDDIEDFYQDEPLVVRLNRLVDGYPCDSGIFKELIQNADDANATEIHFIKDYTMHSQVNIIDCNYGPLQGPALLVFNDSSFTNKDLKGIQSLGRGSKSDDPSQTGRYGVGFNAVYNLTDSPSFYTKGGDIENGETLCLFDPLAKYLPNVTRKRPGKRIKNVEWLRGIYGDMMSGYHEKELMTKSSGTIFRFPLRTQKMAETSEIKKEAVDMETISILLNAFSEDIKNILLFLKHLRKVKISSCINYHLKEEFYIEVQMKPEDVDKRSNFVQQQMQLCKSIKSNKEHLFQFDQIQVAYEMAMHEQCKSQQTNVSNYVVIQVLGFQKDSEVNQIIKESIANGKLGLLPHGGLALRYRKGQRAIYQTYWETNDKCKAFCFLPLPIETGLPVHVHGYFALDHETRRTLWRSEDIDACYRSSWNNLLIEQVISTAYVYLLNYIKKIQFRGISDNGVPSVRVFDALASFYSLFPCLDKVSDAHWKYLLTCFFQQLVLRRIPFLPILSKSTISSITDNTMLKWTSLIIPDSSYPAYVSAEEKGSKYLNEILLLIGMRIIYIPKEVSDAMAYSNVNIYVIEPAHVIAFISGIDCQSNSSRNDECKLQSGEQVIKTALKTVENAATILEYCLKDIKSFITNVEYLPLLVTMDNKLQTVPENGFFFVEPMDHFCDFFASKRHLFLHSTIAKVIHVHLSHLETKLGKKLKRFELIDFVSLAKGPGQIYENCNSSISWDKISPPELWIRLFWNFFCYQLPDNEIQSVGIQLKIVGLLPLLPVNKTASEEVILVQPCNIKSLINLNSFIHNKDLHMAMKTLNLPQISKSFFERYGLYPCFEMLQEHTAHFQNPVEIIECLYFSSCKTNIKKLSDYLANEILLYFEKSQLHKFPQGSRSKLKELPLFLSHFGKRVMLKYYNTIFVVPKKLPTEGIEELAEKANVLFLCSTGHTNLFEYLGIEELSMMNVYTKYIIPMQNVLQRGCFYAHLNFLSCLVIDENDVEWLELLSVLRNSAFVETIEGRRVRVCELYDPDHRVFKRMCKAEKLVPDCLRLGNILMLFRKIGLKTEMTMSLYERFAKRIKKRENFEGISKDVREDSRLLSTDLWMRDKKFYTHQNFDTISKIRFVTPHVVDESLSAIESQYNCSKLICFEDSVQANFSNISWTVSNILPKHLAPRVYDQHNCLKAQKLKIYQNLPKDKLIRHCVHIGKCLEKKISLPTFKSHEMLMHIMTDVYQALKTFHDNGEINDEDVDILQGIPIIYFSEKRLITTAKHVVIDCKPRQEIPPFLLKCPQSYQMYAELFLQLGSSSAPTCEQFAFVLHELKLMTAESELHPFEYANAIKAMGNFFRCLVKQGDTVALSVERLFLLSYKDTLEDAKSIVVPNNEYFKTQLAKCKSETCMYIVGFVKLQEYKLKLEEILENLKYLPDKYRPHLLTDIVSERVLLEHIKYTGHQNEYQYKSFLHSMDFVFGFLRLTRHVWKKESIQWAEKDEKEISSAIKTIDFKQCSGIQTQLAIKCIENGTVGNERFIDNTNDQKFIHIERNGDGACVYFDTAEDSWNHSLTTSVAIFLNELVGKCFRDEFFVILMDMISMVKSPERIPFFLSKGKIEEYTLLSIDIDTPPSVPIPGNIVPKKFHQYLDNGYGFINEYDYQFIALEVDDPGLNLHDYGNSQDDTEDKDIDFELTYKFVHIIKMVGPRHELPLFQEYEVNYGSEETAIVRAYKLFKFIRKSNITSGTDTDVILYKRNEHHEEDESSLPSSLRDAYSEIKRILREAWQKEPYERTGIVKRLYRKWHPDKNPDNVQFCTKVFQYIQQCLARLEKGLDLKNDDDEEDDQFNSRSSTGHSYSGWSYGNTWYDRYWFRFRRSENNTNSSNRNSNTRGTFSNFDDSWSHRETYYEPYHWYNRANKWYKQAEYDLKHAMVSLEQLDDPQFNWICYNTHQAAEKALKAAWYAKDANKINRVKTSHNIADIARDLGSSLYTHASQLSMLIGEHTRMRYPDDLMCNLPAEIYTEQTARSAIKLAETILRLVKTDYTTADRSFSMSRIESNLTFID